MSRVGRGSPVSPGRRHGSEPIGAAGLGHNAVPPVIVRWTSKTSGQRFWLFLSSFCLASGVMLYDYLIHNKTPITKWPVDLSAIGLLRSILICVAAYLLVKALHPNTIDQSLHLIAKYLTKIRIEIAFTLVFFIIIVLMIIIYPSFVRHLSNEDGVIENMSAIFLALAALLLFSSWRYKDDIKASSIVIIPIWFLQIIIGIVFIVILLEEISWGQRILGVPTPELFLANDQEEVNFHNFQTWLFENLYYATAVSAFVLLPYAATNGPPGRASMRSRIFVPPPEFAVIAAPVAFLQAEMWNNVPVQGGAWATFFILLNFARVTQDRTRYLILFILVVCVIGQVIFLINADFLGHQLTEYKETMIAFLCLAYAGIVAKLARNDPRPWMEFSDPWLKLYIGMGFLTLVIQVLVHASQCTSIQDCGLSFAKAIAWSAIWPAYWVVYSAPVQ